MEAAGDAKRLAPLEPRVAKLEESLRAAHAELEQAQREMTAHQSSIRQAAGPRAQCSPTLHPASPFSAASR